MMGGLSPVHYTQELDSLSWRRLLVLEQCLQVTSFTPGGCLWIPSTQEAPARHMS